MIEKYINMYICLAKRLDNQEIEMLPFITPAAFPVAILIKNPRRMNIF